MFKKIILVCSMIGICLVGCSKTPDNLPKVDNGKEARIILNEDQEHETLSQSNDSAPEQASSINKTDSNSVENIVGEWEISKVLLYGNVGTYDQETAEGLVGKSMIFSSETANCFGDDPSYVEEVVNDPEYIG